MTEVSGRFWRHVGQQIEAVVVAQADIDQGQVVRLAIDRGDPFGQAGGRIGLVALLAEPVGHRAQHVAIVVYQQECGLVLHGFACFVGWAVAHLVPRWAKAHPTRPSPNIYVTGDGSQRAAIDIHPGQKVVLPVLTADKNNLQ